MTRTERIFDSAVKTILLSAGLFLMGYGAVEGFKGAKECITKGARAIPTVDNIEHWLASSNAPGMHHIPK